jgi:RND family efflux transporter MFP subunit
MRTVVGAVAVGTVALLVAACGSERPAPRPDGPPRTDGTVFIVKDTSVRATFAALGTAEAVRQATLSTKLMGTVLQVFAKEGDIVAAGQPLVRIDARDLVAQQAQIAASIADAEATQREASTNAGRMRALYADSAATRAQLDAAETGLARADAGVRAANAAAASVTAMASYSVVRAPFAGVITKRLVDPGAFATPGAPLMTVQDGRQLRITATATPDIARELRRGQSVAATIEGRSLTAVVEGIIPGAAGNLYAINALVANPGGALLPGSTATLLVPLGSRNVIAVPMAAVLRQGDLTGVTLRTASGDEVRWVRLGAIAGELVEVNAGLSAGDQVVIAAHAGVIATGR